MTLSELVEAMSARLTQAGVSFGHGTSNADDEAAWLVLWALHLPLDAMDTHAARLVQPSEAFVAEALVERRIRTRKPAAYLTNQAWLQGVAFHVDERVIVPRSFIAELLADATIDAWLAADTRRVLDLCTGSGCLAVLAAMAWPEVRVDAADISPEALEVARINVEAHEMQERIRLVRSDGLAALDGPYELILCNPPYVNAVSMAALPAEYRAEPTLALDGGLDGMDFIRRLLAEAPLRLSDGGVLVLEIGNERANFEHAFRRLEVAWMETSAGSDHVLLVTRDALARWSRK